MNEPPDSNKDKSDKGGILPPENSEEITNPLLPDPDSIVSEVSFISPSGKEIKIIKTNERDEYEQSPAKKTRRHPKD